MSERKVGKLVWRHEVVSLARFQELEHSRYGRSVKIGDQMIRLEKVEARGFTFVPVSGYQVLAYIFGEEVPPTPRRRRADAGREEGRHEHH